MRAGEENPLVIGHWRWVQAMPVHKDTSAYGMSILLDMYARRNRLRVGFYCSSVRAPYLLVSADAIGENAETTLCL